MNEIKEGSAHAIAECGIFTALGVVMVLISTYIPVIGTLMMLVWAVPIIALVIRRGVAMGVISAVVVCGISVLLTGPVMGILAGLSVGIFGIVYGAAFRKGASPGKTLFVGTIAAGLITMISLALTMFVGNLSLQDLFGGFEKSVREVFALYDEMGVLSQIVPDGYTAAEYINRMISVFYRILPGMFILIAMAMAAANYVFSAILLRKFHFEIKSLPPFRAWHFPWWIMWGVALILLGYLMGKQFDNDHFLTMSLNLLYIYFPVFLLAGISILSYFFSLWRLGKGVQVVLWIIAALFINFALPFLILMGAIDTLLDYRKILRRVTEKK